MRPHFARIMQHKCETRHLQQYERWEDDKEGGWKSFALLWKQNKPPILFTLCIFNLDSTSRYKPTVPLSIPFGHLCVPHFVDESARDRGDERIGGRTTISYPAGTWEAFQGRHFAWCIFSSHVLLIEKFQSFVRLDFLCECFRMLGGGGWETESRCLKGIIRWTQSSISNWHVLGFGYISPVESWLRDDMIIQRHVFCRAVPTELVQPIDAIRFYLTYSQSRGSRSLTIRTPNF